MKNTDEKAEYFHDEQKKVKNSGKLKIFSDAIKSKKKWKIKICRDAKFTSVTVVGHRQYWNLFPLFFVPVGSLLLLKIVSIALNKFTQMFDLQLMLTIKANVHNLNKSACKMAFRNYQTHTMLMLMYVCVVYSVCGLYRVINKNMYWWQNLEALLYSLTLLFNSFIAVNGCLFMFSVLWCKCVTIWRVVCLCVWCGVI